jgi:hypothetical protein
MSVLRGRVPGMTTRLAPERYLELLREDADRLAEAAAAGLDAPVPPCPGWLVRDVVQHTGAVYHHKIASMRLQRRPRGGEWPLGPQPATTCSRGSATRSPPSSASSSSEGTPLRPTPGGRRSRRSVLVPPDGAGDRRPPRRRRDRLRRADAGAADLAVDGVDEVLLLMLADDWSDVSAEEWGDVSPHAGAGRTVEVRTGDHAWLVTMHPDRIDVSTEPGSSDAVVTGEPSEVLLWLWGRRPDSAVERTGDTDSVRALRDRLALATA